MKTDVEAKKSYYDPSATSLGTHCRQLADVNANMSRAPFTLAKPLISTGVNENSYSSPGAILSLCHWPMLTKLEVRRLYFGRCGYIEATVLCARLHTLVDCTFVQPCTLFATAPGSLYFVRLYSFVRLYFSATATWSCTSVATAPWFDCTYCCGVPWFHCTLVRALTLLRLYLGSTFIFWCGSYFGSTVLWSTVLWFNCTCRATVPVQLYFVRLYLGSPA
ncbi:hypothetical protein AVEN_201736-1 [Araneus ventricosus]|uniref:Uncharacterized protein n=1 Tax=Araneus ventricosus TaxID=182803 RepID=A0A4Y2WS51_ARAVE|nr:hypothetical protein AVEN_201736-1 [Araneus ventricosus]